MAVFSQELIDFVSKFPGLTDREITNRIRGRSSPQQPVNQAARNLASRGCLVRKKRDDGLIGNYPGGAEYSTTSPKSGQTRNHDLEALSEDEIKQVLERWLNGKNWSTRIAWGKTQGIDIDAKNEKSRWIIEVKGPGSRQPMRVNYFLGILGETLQRMDDAKARYSIALPDLKQYRGLWERLPALAKKRTGISIIFVSNDGDIEILEQ
jgi:hypothetical protein